jgi:hypothetical protein
VEEQEGALAICGIVLSFYHKHLAQEVVCAICRDMAIELVNSIRVSEPKRPRVNIDKDAAHAQN